MSKKHKTTLEVQGTTIAVLTGPSGDFISLTDMLRAKDGDFFISDWLRNRNTVEFLGIWESVHNPDFNYGEFATIKSQAGLNAHLFNANGVAPSSPGLRGTRYPGITSPNAIQPQRGCAPNDMRFVPTDGTALRFAFSRRVHPQGRPHCIRPTLGWRAISRWDMNDDALDLHLFNANGVAPTSPGLRGTRYPGIPSPNAIQPHRGCAPNNMRFVPTGGTALRFAFSRPAHPQGRPHSIRPTLGWRTERPWRSSNSRRYVMATSVITERNLTTHTLDGILTGLGDLK